MQNVYAKANIDLHTSLAEVYRETEPHYRPENIARVSSLLHQLQREISAESLLDIGCGQGFIIDIAKKFFKKIRGIDITQAMLDKVDLSDNMGCDIEVCIASAENLPFRDNEFDTCTAYAVLHHIPDIQTIAKEVCRVLRPGGVFFSSLDPNYYFWEALKSIHESTESYKTTDTLRKELNNTLNKDKELSVKFNISLDVIDTAEAFKHIEGGFREEHIIQWFTSAGFSSIRIEYDWFFGQAKYIHDPLLVPHAKAVDDFLKELLPLTRTLFKYISVFAVK